MKIFKKLHGVTLLLATLLFAACDKEKDPGNTVTPEPTEEHQCRLTKLISDNGYSQNYIYDSSGKIVRIDHVYPSDSSYNWRYQYTYNAAGKAVEEIRVTANNVIEDKRIFAYDANNLLVRMEFYSRSIGGIYHLDEYFLFQYNNVGERILMQHYSGAQSGISDRYSEFTYFQNGIQEKQYNALTVPATLTDSSTVIFDNKKSPFHALGYLFTFPGYDKHNIVSTNSSYSLYEYNSLDYPTKEEGAEEFFF